MGPAELPITSGATAIVEVLQVDGDLVLVRFVKQPQEPLSVVQVGAITPVPGYEGVVARLVSQSVSPGQLVKATWISGAAADQFARITLQLPKGETSPDVLALRQGWATPSGDHVVAAVRPLYRNAIQEAARLHRGAWGDDQAEAGLRQNIQEILGLKEGTLRPTYVDAHPGLGLALALGIIVVLVLVMKREHAVLVDETKESGPVRRAFQYALRSNLRMFGGIFLPRRQALREEVGGGSPTTPGTDPAPPPAR